MLREHDIDQHCGQHCNDGLGQSSGVSRKNCHIRCSFGVSDLLYMFVHCGGRGANREKGNDQGYEGMSRSHDVVWRLCVHGVHGGMWYTTGSCTPTITVLSSGVASGILDFNSAILARYWCDCWPMGL